MYKPKVPPEYDQEEISMFLENLATVMMRYSSTPKSTEENEVEKKKMTVPPHEIKTIVAVVKEMEKFLEKLPEAEEEKPSTCEKLYARCLGITPEQHQSQQNQQHASKSTGEDAPRLAMERVNTLTKFRK
jgi:hypothetical protein